LKISFGTRAANGGTIVTLQAKMASGAGEIFLIVVGHGAFGNETSPEEVLARLGRDAGSESRTTYLRPAGDSVNAPTPLGPTRVYGDAPRQRQSIKAGRA
jgi:hypothetical protein